MNLVRVHFDLIDISNGRSLAFWHDRLLPFAPCVGAQLRLPGEFDVYIEVEGLHTFANGFALLAMSPVFLPPQACQDLTVQLSRRGCQSSGKWLTLERHRLPAAAINALKYWK